MRPSTRAEIERATHAIALGLALGAVLILLGPRRRAR
jgi:hypothetical protein